MSKNNQLTEKELKDIQEIQGTNTQNINQLGILEFQIQKMNNEKINIATLIEKTEEKFQNELKTLEKKYGNINLDITTGKFTEVQQDLETVTK
tara:strand:+ start:576 stop:854 length:279 start_codon:yes stop_codon:yes gene_type:complete